jgi:hypothetical protein
MKKVITALLLVAFLVASVAPVESEARHRNRGDRAERALIVITATLGLILLVDITYDDSMNRDILLDTVTDDAAYFLATNEKTGLLEAALENAREEYVQRGGTVDDKDSLDRDLAEGMIEAVENGI